MKFDDLGLLITNEESIGRVGDSLSEQSRLCLISEVIHRTFDQSTLEKYFTAKGILRHPNSPWGIDDTSEDQKLPLFLCLDYINEPTILEKYKSFDKLWFLKRLVGIRTLGQALIFRIPFRWNDGKKAFEKSSDSSCDYLNFGAQIFYAHLTNRNNLLIRQAKKLVPQEKMIERVSNYYSNDLANNQWLIDLWIKAIEIVWA